MKKTLFVAIFIIMGHIIFSQSDVMRFFSLGFNTFGYVNSLASNYFFYGYEDYSEAFISLSGIELSIAGTTFFPQENIIHGFGPRVYFRYMAHDDTLIYGWHLPMGQEIVEEIHRYENGKLVYWATAFEREITVETELIEQNTRNILIASTNRRYYNISKDALLRIFLENYVRLIREIIDLINGNKYSQLGEHFTEDFFNGQVQLLLSGRTSRELAIFRNCLYAIKGYRFSTLSWTAFFKNYLPNYNARYSNAEATAMFTDNERRLLDLIIEYENRI
jgi:hypothetical protein